jgi:hypothetical protein
MRRLVKTIPLVVAALWLTACEKYALDRQMEELCKKDGGVKVYETVKLPGSEFDSQGQPLTKYIMAAKEEEKFGPDYRYVVLREELKTGDPFKGEGRLTRFEESIYRRADSKLLGNAVTYSRAGGDLIVLSHPSSNSCPKPRINLVTEIFLKG